MSDNDSLLDTNWWRHGVVYQIYPRSFMDGDGDGSGDIAGIIAKLPYLKQLGIDAIWLTPWYKSPMADGGYDVADYREIDHTFGSLAEAEELIRLAGASGIRVIVDVVPNHVSREHGWFTAATATPPGSPERSRFWFVDALGDGTQMPTNWLSSFRGPTWTRVTNPDGTPGQWYLHLFTAQQPDLNWTSPDVRAEFESILRFWFDRGAAGVRIDSATLIVKDPAFPDVDPSAAIEPGRHPFIDRDEIHDIYRAWRKVADSYDPPRVLVGEVWLDDPKRFAAYLRQDEMHTAFNFDFMSRPWDAGQLRESIDMTLAAHAQVGAPATWVLSNHDVTRPVTRYGRADTSFSFAEKHAGAAVDLALGTRRARAAFMLAAALPGSLYVYQGEELGLPEDEDLPIEAIQDPMFFSSCGADPGRDGCRVPLPWTAEGVANYGFSTPNATAPAWLPQPEWWGAYAVDAEASNADSMLTFYRRALAIRREHGDFATAAMTWLADVPPSCLAFRRGGLVCLVNFGDEPIPAPDGVLLLASGAMDGRLVGVDTAVWVMEEGRPI